METLLGIPGPSLWGTLLLLVAFLSAVFQTVGIQRFRLEIIAFMAVALAMIVLVFAHVTDDFRLLSVVLHSHTNKPLIYKIAGVWGYHEGSMLLWVLWLAFFNLWVTRWQDNMVRVIFGFLLSGILIYLMVASDPFLPVTDRLSQGDDQNPMLQDLSLAFHPPILYGGFVGLSLSFAAALAMVIKKTWHLQIQLRFSLLAAWIFLTLGLALGSFWAYYELGWGGWWFWDPVENVALMPWMICTAAMHAALAWYRQDVLRAWALFLSILGFLVSLKGLVFVRSGVLTSVHSFAVDPVRGWCLLGYTGILTIGALAIYLYRLKFLVGDKDIKPLSASGLMVGHLLLMMVAVSTVSLGTYWPLITHYLGSPVSVGAPYFNTILAGLLLPFLALMIAIRAIWSGAWVWSDLLSAFIITGSSFWVLMTVLAPPIVWGGLMALSVGTLASSFAQIVKRKAVPMALSHGGFALMLLGILFTTLKMQEQCFYIHPGESVKFAGRDWHFVEVQQLDGPNFKADRAVLQNLSHQLKPEQRYYWTQDIQHTETVFVNQGMGHVHAALQGQTKDKKWCVRMTWKPWVNVLWAGVCIMILGGLFALYRMRLAAFALFLCIVPPCYAQSGVEERVQSLAKILYCPVCQGQSVADSDVHEAKDIRNFIREQLYLGQKEENIEQALVQQYGEMIRLKPKSLWLWLTPWVFLLFGGLLVGWRWTKKYV